MNQLDPKTRKLIIRCLVEGQSIRSTARTAEVSKNTVLKLLVDAGKACGDFQDKALRGLHCRRIQCDEIWSFIYAKKKNVPRAIAAPPKAGDVWTWTAICADTKLVPSWRVGDRSGQTAIDLMDDLCSRLEHRVQLTTDGLKAYLEAVEGAFGGDIDYAQLVKMYGNEPSSKSHEKKYSPAECTGIKKRTVEGDPDPQDISTSYVERNNLTTRMTNAFSKKIENHAHSVALHFMYYNFCRIHMTLKMTPAMAAGVTDHAWTLDDIVRVVDAAAPKPGPRGPYKKRNSN